MVQSTCPQWDNTHESKLQTNYATEVKTNGPQQQKLDKKF